MASETEKSFQHAYMRKPPSVVVLIGSLAFGVYVRAYSLTLQTGLSFSEGRASVSERLIHETAARLRPVT